MQLPVDIKALVDEMTDIGAARETPLSFGIYLDEAAPSDLSAHVRGIFASSSANVRLTLSYLDETFIPHPADDIALIVAGASEVVGPAATALRAVGVPVMVVCAEPSAVAAKARSQGHEIPEGDIIASREADGAAEPFSLDDESAEALDERIGRWIVSVCRDKRLAFAIAFPFMRRPLAKDAVQTTSLQNAGVGLVPIIQGADLPIITLNQAKMTLQIAAAYGQEMGRDRLKELAAVVGGAYLSRGLVRRLVAAVPVLGFAIRTGVAYGTTSAMGYAVIEYFEGGENVTGVANVAERAYAAGAKVVEGARGIASDPQGFVGQLSDKAPELREKAGNVVRTAQSDVSAIVPVVREAIGEYLPKLAEAAGDAVTMATGAFGKAGTETE